MLSNDNDVQYTLRSPLSSATSTASNYGIVRTDWVRRSPRPFFKNGRGGKSEHAPILPAAGSCKIERPERSEGPIPRKTRDTRFCNHLRWAESVSAARSRWQQRDKINDRRRFCLPQAVAKSSVPNEVRGQSLAKASGCTILQPPPVGRIGTEFGLSATSSPCVASCEAGRTHAKTRAPAWVFA